MPKLQFKPFISASKEQGTNSSLKQIAIRGAVWTVLSYGTSQVLRLGSNLILTRLLFPELFGLMALVNTFLIGLQLFSDIGLGPSIIQNKRGDDPEFLNTAWTLQVLRGCLLWIASILLAVPIANLYAEPQLKLLIPIIGINTFISGFNSTSLFTLSRHIELRTLSIFEITVQLVSLIVMVTWASLSPTIWALVAGSIVATLFKMMWSFFLIPGKPNKFTWDKSAAKEIFSFGRWIFFSTAVTFIGTQADRLILGKLLSFELLGIYGIALTLALIPNAVTSALSGKVLLPTFSKLIHLPRETFRNKMLRNRRYFLLAGLVSVALLASFGDQVILFLYDSRYSQAAWMLPILALGIWPNLLLETCQQSLMALGKPKYLAFGQFFKCIHVVVGIPLAYHFMGILGTVIVVALNDLPLYIAVNYGLWRERLFCIKQDILATLLLIILLGLILMARSFLGFGLPISEILAIYLHQTIT